MFKMLIVEDERWEREGLTDFLDWSSLGIELSGLACDGIEGLEKAGEIQPDIIITDIKMPGMDGLKMSGKIREFLPNVKIIILTGYDDFKLAKDAISISANAYILKPVEEAELLDVLEKVLEECRKDLKKHDEEKMLKELLDENRASVRRELISGILKEKPADRVLQQVSQMEILPDCGRYAVIASGLSHRGMDGFFVAEEERESDAAKAFEPADLAEGIGAALALHPSDGTLLLIAGGMDITPEELELAAETIVSRVSLRGYRAVAGIGGIVESLQELHASCQQAREALNYGLFWGEGGAVSHTALERHHQEQTQVGEFLVKGNYYTKQLMHALRAVEEERMNALLDELFRLIESCKWAERNLIANFLYGLLNEISMLFYNTNLSELDEGTAGALLLSLPDYDSIRGYTRSFFEKAMGIIRDKRSNKDEYVVKKVEQIVTERFHSDISIKTIAAEIYLSPNYLGSIFRKCRGIPFNDYLCQFRMEKAKELLQSPKNKVSKVAKEVGIPNPSYFCQLFKEVFGIAPGEYQEMIIRGNN